MNQFNEFFEYNNPYPEKETVYKVSNPVMDFPTIEDRSRDALSGFSFLAMENDNDGLKMPTADSDRVSNSSLTHKNEFPIGGTSAMEPRNNLHETDNNIILSYNNPAINYNFNTALLDNIIFEIADNNISNMNNKSASNRLADLLNELFLYSKCNGIIYTENTDNIFFGIRCYPDMDPHQFINLFKNSTLGEQGIPYKIEFDSKLFNPLIGLSEREIVAIMLYSIYNTIINSVNMEQLKFNISNYMANSLCDNYYTNSNLVDPLLYYGIADSMMKYGNPLNKANGLEVSQNDILKLFKYSGDMEFGLRKLANNIDYFKQDADRRNIVLSYVLRIIDDYEHLRIHAYNQIVKSINLTGSVLERQILRMVTRCLSDTSVISEYAMLEDSIINNSDDNDSLNIIDIRNKIVEMKVWLTTVLSIDELSKMIDNVNNITEKILLKLDNPYLDEKTRNTWEDILNEIMNIKLHITETKDYLDRQHNNIIPIEYLNMNESVIL